MTTLRAVLTVTVETKPDGDYYFDHADFLAHVVPWIEGGLDDRDDIRTVTITEQPAAVPSVPADRAAILREAADAAAEKHRRNPWTTAADVIAELRRKAVEAQPTQRQIQCADAFWLRQPHAPHDWQQRPDAQPVRCPGIGEAQQLETHADGWHLTPQTLDLFVRALVNEVDYDIHKNYECGEEDGADHYPELVAEAAEMLNAITAEQPAEARQADTAGEQQ